MHILKGHTAAVRCLAYSPDGRMLASGSDDHLIKLWDPATSQERGRLTGHTDWVRAVAFSPDGKQLASAGWDDSVRLWGVARKSQQEDHGARRRGVVAGVLPRRNSARHGGGRRV